MKLPKNNLSYPSRILIGDNSGSGFIIKHESILYLVTAKHVIYHQDQLTKLFVLRNNILQLMCQTFVDPDVQHPPRIFQINLDLISSNNNIRPHPLMDIVILKLGNIGAESSINLVDGITTIQESAGDIINYEMSNSRRFADVEISNDVFTLGYPVSLSSPQMNHISYDTPLVRKGIISGKNYVNSTIILDCPVYGGNSGGLVLEINTTDNIIHLVGVVVQFVPFLDQWNNVRFPELLNTNYQNSGYSVAVPVDFIYDLIEEMRNI